MAQDDVIVVITANMAPGDTTDRQPGAGVEEIVLDLGDVNTVGSAPDRVPDIDLNRIDGTNNQAIMEKGENGAYATSWFMSRHPIDNTNYARITHQGSSTGDYTFCTMVVG
jgi:hypothetical protein